MTESSRLINDAKVDGGAGLVELKAHLARAEGIVKDLANAPGIGDYGAPCQMCNAPELRDQIKHTEDCPFARAVAYVKGET